MRNTHALWLDFLNRLDHILVYRKGEQRAPHKPLYLLFCIASLQQGLPRLQSFEAINQSLSEALRRFGLRTKALHPEYPFWRLQNDNLAVVEGDAPFEFRKSNDDPKRTSLLRAKARGGFLEQDHAMLRNNLDLQSTTVHKILDAHFPVSIHDEIIRHFGLVLNEPHSRDIATEKEFHQAVLAAYGNSCALTGFSVNFRGSYVGVEAAHICWPQVGGNDHVYNGIAMTTLHRKLFHLGLFDIDENFTVRVSKEAGEDQTAHWSLRNLHGKQIALPKDPSLRPSLKALNWHSRWVFRG